MKTQIDSYLKRLFPICRSITGNGNRQTLQILQEIVPLTIHEVHSDTKVFDWTIPDEWNIKDAWIATQSGRRIVDFNECNLHVVNYSIPVDGEFTWETLKDHLHVHSEIPEAIPYRTAYYNRTWGFCVTHSQFQELKQCGGPFKVVIDSKLEPGSLTYGEILLKGKSDQEILISTYFCHPSMANDNLSGVLLTAFLAKEILSNTSRYYSYRIVFVPETIGAITYCFVNESAMKKIDIGLVVTTVGGSGQFGYKQSYNKDHAINRVIEEVFEESKIDYITYPFDIHGSDERQYSSQGFGINIATICRDRYYEYSQYHTSLDNLAFVNSNQIYATLSLYLRLIEKLETRRIYRNRIPNCEIMLSKHELYPKNGGALKPELGGRSELDLILWLLFLCDGRKSLADISCQLDVSEDRLCSLAEKIEMRRILEHV